jgi:rubrerythrin
MSVHTQLLKALEDAIQAEIEGYHFYTMSAKATEDEQTRAMFERLAQDEVKHAEFLRGQHRSLETTGRVDKVISILGEPDASTKSPLVSEALRARAAKAHVEMTALSVGAQLEADAIRFYNQQAGLAEDPEVAAFFRHLAEWEKGHHDLLVAQMKELEAEYWAANRFAPF